MHISPPTLPKQSWGWSPDLPSSLFSWLFSPGLSAASPRRLLACRTQPPAPVCGSAPRGSQWAAGPAGTAPGSAAEVARAGGAVLPGGAGICPGSCLELSASAGHRAWPEKHRANVETKFPPKAAKNLDLGVSIPASLWAHGCPSLGAEHGSVLDMVQDIQESCERETSPPKTPILSSSEKMLLGQRHISPLSGHLPAESLHVIDKVKPIPR